MKSQLITSVPIDNNLLKKELIKISFFQFSNVYQEFICGEFRSCMLWNKRGDIKDSILEKYDASAKETSYINQLPYIKELITDTFNLDYLRFARILSLAPNSVFMPHRDYLELKNNYIRIHLPIKTDQYCFHSEEDKVYHMSQGEIWYLDATKTHSAASFSSQMRLHIVLDFAYTENISDLFKIDLNKNNLNTIPEEAHIERPELSPDAVETIYGLHKIIDSHNYYNVLAILIKQYFKYNVGANTVYDWLLQVSELSLNQLVIDKTNFLKNYCLLKR